MLQLTLQSLGIAQAGPLCREGGAQGLLSLGGPRTVSGALFAAGSSLLVPRPWEVL